MIAMRILATFAALSTLAACGSTTPEATSPDLAPRPSANAGALRGTTWVLGRIGGAPPLGEARITLRVDETTGGGFSGCNHYGGVPVVTDDTFRFDDLVSTLMACVDERMMEQEADYLDLLARTGKWEIVGNELVLTVGEATLEYRPAED
jgi:heat shock protein HslJ